MPNHQDAIAAFRSAQEFAAFDGSDADGFFQKNMFAGLERRERKRRLTFGDASHDCRAGAMARCTIDALDLTDHQIPLRPNCRRRLLAHPGAQRFDVERELPPGTLGCVLLVSSVEPETFREARAMLTTAQSARTITAGASSRLPSRAARTPSANAAKIMGLYPPERSHRPW